MISSIFGMIGLLTVFAIGGYIIAKETEPKKEKDEQ